LEFFLKGIQKLYPPSKNLKIINLILKEWKVSIWHCSKCHHEWETTNKEKTVCDWCGADGYVLEE